MHHFLRIASRWCALFGVAIGLAVALVAVVSIIGRAALSRPILGDVELAQVGIALCISLCLPWCQLRRGHIIVDFFTQRMAAPQQWLLDALGGLLMAIMCVLLAWRSAVGALSVHEAMETTMILGLPMWWAYAGLVPGLVLSAVVAFWQSVLQVAGYTADRQGSLSRDPLDEEAS